MADKGETAEIRGPDVDEPWTAPDGTEWVFSPGLDVWTGWQPGEDGCWMITPAQFAEWWPEYSAMARPPYADPPGCRPDWRP